MPHCNLASMVLTAIGCCCALPCLYLGIPLFFWPIGEWITWGDTSFDLTCGDQWIVDVYYDPKVTKMTCKEIVDQVNVTFTGTPPENETKDLSIIPSVVSCIDSSSLQAAVVTDGTDADKALKTEDLSKAGILAYYLNAESGGCWAGGLYKVESPVALWVKENSVTSGINSILQSLGVVVYLGCAFGCCGFFGCIGLFVCLLSEDPARRAVQPPPSQVQMQPVQMQQGFAQQPGQVQMQPQMQQQGWVNQP